MPLFQYKALQMNGSMAEGQNGRSFLLPWLPLALAVSLERLLSGFDKARLSKARSRFTNAPFGGVLDVFYSVLLHVFHNSGILLDALLSGAGAPDRIGACK